ncbi:GerAB/ArcD/ProY family transporter [Paenibacillus sp. UNC451MF]|uniref:GerAB/ArcD/ProY family transporter n=1 Tax=Paenibacillus sp. UNC451MF TaxID=1449063 RepID=UPI00048DB7FF|nr:endospore germination permease [Paenibacillus sp. UNC451MF]
MDRYDNAKISVRQFSILIMIGIIGDSILVLPTIVAASAKQDAWLSMLLALLLGLASGILFGAIANKLQGKSLITGAREKLGIWGGSFFGILFLVEFYMCDLTLLSEMSQFMTTQMMPETPVNAIILFFIAVIIIAYRYGLEAFARMGELLFPIIMMLFVFLVVFLIPQADTSNLLPIAGHGMGPIMNGIVPAFTFGFAEMVVLLMLVPHVVDNTKLTKPILTSFVLGGTILFLVVLFCVLVLGSNLMETKYYPTFVLAQKIQVGNFLERLEAIIAFLWIITVFYKTLLNYFALTTGIAQLLRLKESHMLTIPIGMILLVSAIVSTPNITVYNDILNNYYPWFDMSFCVGLPIVFLIMLFIAGKRKKDGKINSI